MKKCPTWELEDEIKRLKRYVRLCKSVIRSHERAFDKKNRKIARLEKRLRKRGKQ